MPKINAYADVFRDWDALLGACERNADLLPGVDPFKLELQSFRDRLRELKLDQEHLAGHRKAATQRVTRTLDGGRESARKLRLFITSLLGSRDELLTQFGVPPNRSRKVARNQPEKPTTGPTPTPQPTSVPTVATEAGGQEAATPTNAKEEQK
jgi:hypothetical protein